MEKIESFKINHLLLKEGLYVSRIDNDDLTTTTTFDLRFVAPYSGSLIDYPAIHTIEHLGATFLRNSKVKDKVVYFGPMGCRTGFYFIMFGKLTSLDVYDLVIEMLDFIINFEGEIPGATKIECGNYLEQDLNLAKKYASDYKNQLITNKRLEYPI